MLPIGHILNYDERREFQNRGTDHIHPPVHIVDALRLDEDDETKCEKAVSFINN